MCFLLLVCSWSDRNAAAWNYEASNGSCSAPRRRVRWAYLLANICEESLAHSHTQPDKTECRWRDQWTDGLSETYRARLWLKDIERSGNTQRSKIHSSQDVWCTWVTAPTVLITLATISRPFALCFLRYRKAGGREWLHSAAGPRHGDLQRAGNNSIGQNDQQWSPSASAVNSELEDILHTCADARDVRSHDFACCTPFYPLFLLLLFSLLLPLSLPPLSKLSLSLFLLPSPPLLVSICRFLSLYRYSPSFSLFVLSLSPFTVSPSLPLPLSVFFAIPFSFSPLDSLSSMFTDKCAPHIFVSSALVQSNN